jgi:DNA-binding SARP family transcriptional activator/DNA-binding HxlR family transcriptional regulator
MTQVERWNLLFVGEALKHHATTFEEFQRSLDLDPGVVQQRLDDLIQSDLMRAQVDATGEETEYLLTEKGRDLDPVIAALDEWGETWAPPGPVAAELTVERTGDEPASPGPLIQMSLFGSFRLRVDGIEVAGLAIGSQRLLVFLALHDRAVTRLALAGTMWPEVSEEKAGTSLRSALTRLDTVTREAILVANAGLELADAVAVDVHSGRELANRMLQPTPSRRLADLSSDAVAALSQELLPDWYDDWVVAEAEDWRQLRVTALEAIALELVERARFAEAAMAARAAIRVEPLRESAHASLIRVHLAEGNQTEALRVFDHYRELLADALDLEPTEQLSALVADLRKV